MGTTQLEHASSPPESRRSWWPGAALVAMTLLLYLPATRCGFIWDDDLWVTENTLLRSWDGLPRIWTDLAAVPEYYPLTLTSFWLDYQLWGLRAAGYHIENILLHAGMSLLLWRVLLKLNIPGAWLAAAVVAVHPLNVESVAWVTERKNVLSGALYLAAVWTFLRAFPPLPVLRDHQVLVVGERAGVRVSWYLLTLLFYVLAVLAKTVTVTLPVVLLILTWWRRGKLTFKDFARMVPFFAVALPLGLLAVWKQKHHTGATGEMFEMEFGQRLIIAGRAIWFYLSKIIWPTKLTFINPRWKIDSRDPLQYAWPASVIVLLVVLTLSRGSTDLAEVKRLRRGLLAAILIFIVTLFPALGFFNILWQIYSFVADHVQYIAAIPIIALLAAGFDRLLGKRQKPIGYAAVLLPLSIFTWRQQAIYKNTETLWVDTIEKDPSSWMAHNNLAMVYFDRNDFIPAERSLRKSLELNSRNDIAKGNLATLLTIRGNNLFADQKPDEALSAYNEASALTPNEPAAHHGIGLIMAGAGEFPAAEREFKLTLRGSANSAEVHNNLGKVLAAQGKLAEAIPHYRRALELNPRFAKAQKNLADAEAALGSQKP